MGWPVTGQTLLPRADGLYLGVDPGTDGAAALVRREGERLTLLGVALARAAGDGVSPGLRASNALATLCLFHPGMTVTGERLAGAVIEAPAARARQSGALVLAQSAGAYAGIVQWRWGLDADMPQSAAWLADLACLAEADAEAGQRKALHVARLLDVCPGAEPHLRPPRSQRAHDGAADAALLALWAAGLRGPGPSSPLYRLAVCEQLPTWVARMRMDTGESVGWPTGTAAQIWAVAAGGRWAQARGRVEAEPSAVALLRGIVQAGSPARSKAASAALVAWGVSDGR